MSQSATLSKTENSEKITQYVSHSAAASVLFDSRAL